MTRVWHGWLTGWIGFEKGNEGDECDFQLPFDLLNYHHSIQCHVQWATNSYTLKIFWEQIQAKEEREKERIEDESQPTLLRGKWLLLVKSRIGGKMWGRKRKIEATTEPCIYCEDRIEWTGLFREKAVVANLVVKYALSLGRL